jgi:spermidine/putrescine-binding protein
MVNTKISEKDALRFQLRNELIKQPIQRDELRKVIAVLDNPRQLTQTDIDRIIDKSHMEDKYKQIFKKINQLPR